MRDDFLGRFPFVADWLPGTAKYKDIAYNHALKAMFESVGWTKQIPFFVLFPETIEHTRGGGGWHLWVQDSENPTYLGWPLTLRGLDNVILKKIDERCLPMILGMLPSANRDIATKSFQERLAEVEKRNDENQRAIEKEQFIDEMRHNATAHVDSPIRRKQRRETGDDKQFAVGVDLVKSTDGKDAAEAAKAGDSTQPEAETAQ
jgi:hypothetical protein